VCHKSYGTIGKVTGSSFSPDDPVLSSAIMLDQMANRYGMLPSEVLAKGTTQDLFVYDAYVTYSNHEAEKRNRNSGGPPKPQSITSDNLQEKLAKFREQ